jgi:hypothetical protein
MAASEIMDILGQQVSCLASVGGYEWLGSAKSTRGADSAFR